MSDNRRSTMEDKVILNQEDLDNIAGGDTAEGYKWVYVIKKTKCNGCGECISACPYGAIHMNGKKAEIDPGACQPCGGICRSICPKYAPYSKCVKDC